MSNTPKISSFSRIVIVGTTGSGKTTLAKRISECHGIKRIELDSIQWLPNWKEIDKQEFVRLTEQALTGEKWVVDGNYRIVRDLIWSKAEAIIWLDYSFARNFWQLFSRSIHRLLTRKELWAGNRESWALFFSRKSIVVWFFQTYWKRKRDYPLLFAEPKYAHLKILRIKRPRDLEIHL